MFEDLVYEGRNVGYEVRVGGRYVVIERFYVIESVIYIGG